ncbi:MAG TPA: flavohemoglobin expression-modulating QEGLA motif protein [Sphingomicrobium sp.]|nr:flavohemoglobin expression-modulating QEGLA motif protein [Sphingomicrobium sp.]
MTPRPRLRIAPEPFAPEFSETGSLRQPVGRSARAHLDRPLFFLVLHRTADPHTSLARRVAVNSPAYLIWSPEDDLAAAGALEAIVGAMREKFGHMLIVTLSDQLAEPGVEDSPALPSFVATVAARGDERATRAADMLAKAMRRVEIDLRRCEVTLVADPPPDPIVDSLLAGDENIARLSFALPQIHRAPDGSVYPQLVRDLSVACGDALLRSACAFIDDGAAPRHYRSLGRSAVLAAALAADRKLDRISRSFDFLLSISPINTEAAFGQFLTDKGEVAPQFQYRPLTVDPDVAKRKLYAINLEYLEDPLLEHLLCEKRRELDHQLTMLAARNTPAFRPASTLLYGTVDPCLLADANALLDASATAHRPRGAMIDADDIAEAAQQLIAAYRATDDRFAAKVQLRHDLAAGLMVSGSTLMISTATRMARHRLDALLAHEVSVHLLTGFNGGIQGLSIFRSGLAHYEGIQEGLGVFAEWAVGGLTVARVRLLAARVLAVEAMLRGEDFIAVYRLLHRTHGFTARAAFNISARVFRSGGLAKDAIYLQGFRAVCDLVASGGSLNPFWLGKIAPAHVPAIEELLQRGLIHAPLFLPEFLDREDTRARIARLRKGIPFNSILSVE